jgi:multidrug transporter EmrE-like cation transporter
MNPFFTPDNEELLCRFRRTSYSLRIVLSLPFMAVSAWSHCLKRYNHFCTHSSLWFGKSQPEDKSLKNNHRCVTSWVVVVLRFASAGFTSAFVNALAVSGAYPLYNAPGFVLLAQS